MCRFLFFNQKTAYEMRISDWSSDVRSSDLGGQVDKHEGSARGGQRRGPVGGGGIGGLHAGARAGLWHGGKLRLISGAGSRSWSRARPPAPPAAGASAASGA